MPAAGCFRWSSMATRRQSAQLKKAFLESFRNLGNVSASSREVDVSRRSVYKWLDEDPAFEAAYRDAELEATEVMEEEARRRAVEGVSRIRRTFHRGELVDEYDEVQYSDTLLIFLLKARAPQKYRERHTLEHSGPNGGPIVVDDARERLAARLATLAAGSGAIDGDSESEQP